MAIYYGVNRRIDVRIPMRNGVHVSADIYLPDAAGLFPTVLVRTPYDNSTQVNVGKTFASKGYAFVVVDVRGRYDSPGGEY